MLSLVFALITKTFKRDAQPLQMNSYFCNCVSCCLPSAVLPYILLPHFFFSLQFLKKGRKKVLLVEAWLPSEAARIFHRFVLWYTVSVNMQRQATLFCRVETWGGTCQRLYMWFQILRYWFSDRKWCRVCQIPENLCGCFSTCNRSIYSIINNFAQLFGCGYCQWVCCIWWLTW